MTANDSTAMPKIYNAMAEQPPNTALGSFS
jgi:hypothetical protein